MAIIDLMKGSAAATKLAAYSSYSAEPKVIEFELDCTKQAVPSGDTVKIIRIPPKTLLQAFYHEVVTPEGSAGTYDAGITGSTDDYANDVSLNAVNAACFATPTFYEDGAEIVFIPSIALDTAVFRFVALAVCFDS